MATRGDLVLRSLRCPPSWATELVLTIGYVFVGVGYIVAALAVPAGWDQARVAVLAAALAAYAAWSGHTVAVLCLTVVAWLVAAALVADDGGLVPQVAAGLLRLVALLVAAAVGLLVARGMKGGGDRS